ncbi:ATP-binding protein [Streptomyces sp. NPDC088812]|uniref:ATP-binding protein n=1 Tax=Streptomyces sp. NPDC088812 TaxID=3365905 RepID=UPI0038196FE0
MSTNTVDAPAGSAPPVSSAPPASPSVRRGLRGVTDRWPFQRKLNVLVGVPLTVIALLLSYLIVDLGQESERAETAAQLVRNSSQVAELVAAVQAEHQQAILLSVRHEASFDGGTPSTSAYRVAQLDVDTQIQEVRDTFGDRLPAGEAQALREIEGLAGLRSTIEQGYLPADNIDPAYSGAADGLIDGLGLDRNSALATTFTGNLLDSLLRADAAHGAFETGVFSAGTGDSNALIEFTGAVGSQEVYAYQAERFSRFAGEAQTEEFGGIEHNTAMATISRNYAEMAVDPSALQAGSKKEIRKALREVLDSYHLYNEQAETRLEVTGSLIHQIAEQADSAASAAQWRAGLLLSMALLGFVVWIALAVLVRRSVIRPVRALTGAAQEVADVAGRELARVADDDAEEGGPPRLRELPVTADDEIGELAEAFNNVQTTAAALLERQALSRRNVAEMFGNVGRRVSNLTSRQLSLIDAVERGETDPALLERLYSIDHIAVRLRRNADSLMLLAGIRETVLDSGPAALTNVVRAALGQIEGFQRVRLHAGTEALVQPDIIGDLTLMIAELLENAVSFSPEGSPVEVGVDSDDDGATVTIADHGLGMSAERLAEENARLVRRERLDLVPTKVLGLFVVGALARRWDIDVTLSRTPGGGVTAEVALPSPLLRTPSGAEAAPAGATETAASAVEAAATQEPSASPSTPSSSSSSPSTPSSSSSSPSPSTPSSSSSSPSPSSSSSAGPSPALAVPPASADDREPGALPRRVPRREAAAAEEPHRTAPGPTADPGPRAEETPVHARTGAEPGGTETQARPKTDAAAEAVETPETAETAETADSTGAAGGADSTGAGEAAAAARAVGGAQTVRAAEAVGTAEAIDASEAPAVRPTGASRASEAPAVRPTGASRAAEADAPRAEADGGEPTPYAPRTPVTGTRTPAVADARTPADGASGRLSPDGRPGSPGRPSGRTVDADAGGGARPLRRRVRGATLRTTVDAAAQQAARRTVPLADADAVRSALEEFEAAVERAHRDSGGGTGEHPRPPAPRTTEENDRAAAPNDRTASNHRPVPNGRSDHADHHRTPGHHQNHTPEGAEQ